MRRSALNRSDAGSGLLGTSIGVFLFLMLMLVAVQTAFDLYSRSAVSAAAFDAAQLVATEHPRTRAEERARSVLGRYGDKATFDWAQSTPDAVVLTVRVPNPGFLPPALRVTNHETVRTVRVRTEREVVVP